MRVRRQLLNDVWKQFTKLSSPVSSRTTGAEDIVFSAASEVGEFETPQAASTTVLVVGGSGRCDHPSFLPQRVPDMRTGCYSCNAPPVHGVGVRRTATAPLSSQLLWPSPGVCGPAPVVTMFTAKCHIPGMASPTPPRQDWLVDLSLGLLRVC